MDHCSQLKRKFSDSPKSDDIMEINIMGIERKYFQNKGNNTSIYMITFELFTQTKETDWIGRESSSMYYSLQLGPLSFPAIYGNYVWDALIENGKTLLIARCVYEIPDMNALVVIMAIMTTICVNAYKSFLLFDLATGKVTLRKFQNKWNPLIKGRGWKIRPRSVFDERTAYYECLEFLRRNHFLFEVDRGFRREIKPSFIKAVKTFRSTQGAFEEELTVDHYPGMKKIEYTNFLFY